MEGILYPIAVMGIEIDVENALKPLIQKGKDRQNRIVEIAESAGPVGPAVMRTARRIMHHPALLQQPGGQDGGSAGGGGPAENLGEDRVAVAPDIVALLILRRDGPCFLRPDDRIDIIGRVEAGQLLARRRFDSAVAALVQPAERPDHVQHRRDARYR